MGSDAKLFSYGCHWVPPSSRPEHKLAAHIKTYRTRRRPGSFHGLHFAGNEARIDRPIVAVTVRWVGRSPSPATSATHWYATWRSMRINDLVTSALPTVLRTTLKQLRQKVLDEELLSKTVDVNNVATELLATFLGAIEGRRFVDDCVTRSFLAAASELSPSRRIYTTCHRQHHRMETTIQDAGWSNYKATQYDYEQTKNGLEIFLIRQTP